MPYTKTKYKKLTSSANLKSAAYHSLPNMRSGKIIRVTKISAKES